MGELTSLEKRDACCRLTAACAVAGVCSGCSACCLGATGYTAAAGQCATGSVASLFCLLAAGVSTARFMGEALDHRTRKVKKS